MAKVWLNHMEAAGGHLPARCVVCGGVEEIEYFQREMEYRPRWPSAFLGLHLIELHLISAIGSFFSERYNMLVFTKFPYCIEHYDYWDRRDRRHHLGILIMALGWLVPMITTFVMNNNVRMSTNAIAAAVGATVLGLIVVYSQGFKIIHVAGMKKRRVQFGDVHPGFVDAVKEWRDDEG